MSIRITSKASAAAWERFVQEAKPPFSVSSDWAGFQVAAGNAGIPTFGLQDDEVQLASWVFRLRMRFGLSQLRATFSPWFHPDVFKNEALFEELFRSWLQSVRSHAASTDAFVRVEPGVEQGTQNALMYTRVLERLGAMPASRNPSPQHTHIVDCSLSDEELMKDMHPKTRYNIRLSLKKGVVVKCDTSPEALERFLLLHHETTSRQGFSGHHDAYYRTMRDTLAPSGMLELFVAEHEGQALAGALVAFTPTRATYLHGASTSEKRELMAPHALHIDIIRAARERGCSEYDFWGVAPPDAGPEHPWAGVSRFKRGFGGRDVSYLPAYDVPLRPLLTQLVHLLGK